MLYKIVCKNRWVLIDSYKLIVSIEMYYIWNDIVLYDMISYSIIWYFDLNV